MESLKKKERLFLIPLSLNSGDFVTIKGQILSKQILSPEEFYVCVFTPNKDLGLRVQMCKAQKERNTKVNKYKTLMKNYQK